MRRVITGKRQPRGSYYERLCQEQEGEKSGRKCKAVNPVDAALAKKRKVTLSVDTTECKYCGKVYHTVHGPISPMPLSTTHTSM